MSDELVTMALIAVAGFLLGGVYATWQTSRKMAIVLACAAMMAGAGAVAWWMS